MKKTSKLLLLVTMGIVITLVIVSAGCLSMFSAPSSSTTTTTTPQVTPATTYTPDVVSKIDTSKIVTPVVEKKDTMIGKWKESFTNSAYSLTLDIKSESSAEYIMNIKSGKLVNGFSDDTLDLYKDGDILKFDCKLVKKSDGSYSLKAKTCTVLRDGDDIISTSGDNEELGVITYDKTNDSLKITSGGETMKMVRTA